MSASIRRASLVGLFLAGMAFSSPFDLRFTGDLTTAGIPGTSVGDTLTLDLTVDNGGNSTISQTFSYANFGGFTIHVGSYSASYSKVFESSGPITTDAAGNISSVAFYGTSNASNNSDNFTPSFSGDYVFGDGSFNDSLSRGDAVAGWNNPSQWTVASLASATPEPGTVTMLVAGLGLLVAVRLRKFVGSTQHRA